jgi:predicted small secreted protein
MKHAKIILLSCLVLAFLLTGCSNGVYRDAGKSGSKPETVTIRNVVFRTFNNKPQGIPVAYVPVSGVTISLIGSDGEVIARILTNSQGEAQESITVPVDRKYQDTVGIAPRGTVTAIAFKEGYRETVLLEDGISNGDLAQPVPMEPIVLGERNEPYVQLGSNHHLEILALVGKYAKYPR